MTLDELREMAKLEIDILSHASHRTRTESRAIAFARAVLAMADVVDVARCVAPTKDRLWEAFLTFDRVLAELG